MRPETFISSRTNPIVQRTVRLSDKKYRESEKLFLCEGGKLFEEAVKFIAPIETVLLCENKTSDVITRTLEKMCGISQYEKTDIIRLSESAFEKISSEKSPDGVICVINYLDNFRNINKIDKNDIAMYPDEKIMLLYSLRDPGNLGTVFRSAAAFGFDRLILSDDCADIYGSRAMRAAMGAFFKVRADIVSDFSSAVSALCESGRRVFAAELRDGAVSSDKIELCRSDCFIIGNEGHGIPTEVSSQCTSSVYIPIAENSESLNAAIAASVIAYMQR